MPASQRLDGHDAIVAGAGPNGLAAAITLARVHPLAVASPFFRTPRSLSTALS